MSSYASMKQKLRPLRLYHLSEGSAADCELKAYAEGLDPLFAALDECEREAFIGTAEGEGLCARERFLDREKPGLSVEKRRALLLGEERAAAGDGTAAGFARFLADCGLEDAYAREFPSHLRFSIFINDRLNEGEKTLITQKIAREIPAHLTVSLFFQDGSSISF